MDRRNPRPGSSRPHQISDLSLFFSTCVMSAEEFIELQKHTKFIYDLKDEEYDWENQPFDRENKAYQGFSPFHPMTVLERMRASFLHYMESQNEEVEIIKVTKNGTPEEVPFTNKNRMMADVRFMIFILASGNDWEQMLQTSRPQFVRILNRMKSKYNIDTSRHPPGTVLAPQIVTLGRIGACFPSVVCDYFNSGDGKPLVSYADIGLTGDQNIQAGIFCQFFPAMMPREWVKNNTGIHFIPFVVALLCDEKLHRWDKVYTGIADMFNYYAACYNLASMPAEPRVIWSKECGFGDTTGTGFNQALIGAIPYCREVFKSKKENDAQYAFVVRELENLE